MAMEGYEVFLSNLILALGLSLIIGRLFEDAFVRIGVPPVVGDLTAGVIFGTVLTAVGIHIYPQGDPGVDAFAWFGVALLLFYAGITTRYGEFMRTLRWASIITIGEAASAFSLGTLVGLSLGYPLLKALFLGTILEATSVSLTVRTLMDIGKLRTPEGNAILAVAVLDDVSSLLTIAIVTSFAKLHVLEILPAVEIAGLALGFWLGIVLIFHKIANPLVKYSRKLKISDPVLSILLGIFFILAVVAKYFNVSLLVVAYAAGLAFSDARGVESVVAKLRPMAVIFSTLFFVNSAARLNFLTALKPEYTVFYLAMIGAAFLGKLMGGGLFSYIVGYTGWSALRIGVGLFPRAEFCIIAAVAGETLGVVGPAAYFAAILIVLVTNFTAPPLIKLTFTRGGPSGMRRRGVKK